MIHIGEMRERRPAPIPAPVEKPKKGKGKLIIILLLVALISGAGTIGVMLNKEKADEIIKMFEKNEEQTFTMEPYTVNLVGAGKSSSYLKTQISFSFMGEKNTEFLTAKTSQIRDVIILSLMDSKSEELLSASGLTEFKSKLRTKINESLGQDLVKEIFITDILFQG